MGKVEIVMGAWTLPRALCIESIIIDCIVHNLKIYTHVQEIITSLAIYDFCKANKVCQFKIAYLHVPMKPLETVSLLHSRSFVTFSHKTRRSERNRTGEQVILTKINFLPNNLNK